MQREHPGDTAIFINGSTGATLLNASQFSFDYETGGNANLSFNCDHNWGIDLRYEWLGDSSAQRKLTRCRRDKTIIIPRRKARLLNLAETGSTSGVTDPVCRRSKSTSARTSSLDALIGFRYADLSDRLNGVQSQPGETVTTTWNSQNNLYGLQIGAETIIWENPSQRVRIQGYVKAALR